MGGRWRRGGWATAALLACLLTATACGDDGDDAVPTSPDRRPPATTALDTTPTSAPAPTHLAAPAESPIATWAAGHVEAWWAETLPALTGRSYEPVRGPVGAVGVAADTSSCTAADDAPAAAYCPTDDSVLWDGSLVTTVGTELDRLGVGLLVAHEWAHVAQARGLSWGDRDIEDQADCLAGAWARQASADGALGADVDEATVAAAQGTLVDLAAGDHAPQRDREARAASTVEGWRGGPEACAPVAEPPSGGDQP